jgi:hypothetical protein
MENQRIIFSGIMGGTLAAILNAVPILNFINCFCCLGIMLGGGFALIFYDRSLGIREYIYPAIAVTIGITSGIIGAFISMFIEWVVFINFGHWELELLQNMIENLDDIPEYFEEILIELENEMLMGFRWGSVLFRNLILMPIFCLFGSLITRVYINKKRNV